MLKEAEARWTIADSTDLYDLAHWGKQYFSINDQGNLAVHPTREAHQSIDLEALITRLEQRGISLPILLRFSGILQDRIAEIHREFQTAIDEYEYKASYNSIYPIKVNQQRHVVEEVLRFGKPYSAGLEAGSKPELLAVIAITDNETPIICNGFKDEEYVEIAMLAQKLGRNIIPVVEKYSELAIILKYAEKCGVRPNIGMRVKLASRGAGRWSASGGYRSKFGLTVSEVLEAFDELKQRNMADCFKLLHYHQGSQVNNIHQVKAALIEAARIYADLVKRGAEINYLDVGGGLGVDYDGSQSDKSSSINYTLPEYARDVVSHVGKVCDDAQVPHPHLLSESGRAIVAYHSLMVFDVLGVAQQGHGEVPQQIEPETPIPIVDLFETYQNLSIENLQESYHDAQLALDMSLNMFSNGNLSLEHRSMAETLYWNSCYRIRQLASQLDQVPEELTKLDRLLCDTYFCNFSLFQSLPDSWAIEQLFPVMPIHRLDKKPTRHAVIGDITCDSDGKIDHFIDHRKPSRTLRLHELNHSPYYLAVLLVGAYQETLGDLHNLFGDTNAVHVDLDTHGQPRLNHIIKGDTVNEVLHYVQFNQEELLDRMQTTVENCSNTGAINHKEAGRIMRFFEHAMQGYTYLEKPEVD